MTPFCDRCGPGGIGEPTNPITLCRRCLWERVQSGRDAETAWVRLVTLGSVEVVTTGSDTMSIPTVPPELPR